MVMAMMWRWLVTAGSRGQHLYDSVVKTGSEAARFLTPE
jgi:hypothetical protein